MGPTVSNSVSGSSASPPPPSESRKATCVVIYIFRERNRVKAPTVEGGGEGNRPPRITLPLGALLPLSKFHYYANSVI